MGKRAVSLISILFFVAILLLPNSALAVDNSDLPPAVRQQLEQDQNGNVTQGLDVSSNTPSDTKDPVSPKKFGPVSWETSVVKVSRSIFTMPIQGSALLIGTTSGCDPATFEKDFVKAGEFYQGTGGGGIIDTEAIRNIINGALKKGTIYEKRQYNRSTGELIGEPVYDCVPPKEPANTPPKGIAAPPTYEQIWQKVYDQTFIDQSVNNGAYVTPVTTGVTGIPSKFWVQFTGGQNIARTVSVNGFTIVAEAKVTQVQLIVKSPKGNSKTIATLDANSVTGKIDETSFSNPAAIFKYKTAGNYVITTGIVWSANVRITGPGLLNGVDVPGGSLRVELDRNYQVNQIRAGLTS